MAQDHNTVPSLTDLLTPAWWQANTLFPVRNVISSTLQSAGGLSSSMYKLTLEMNDHSTPSLVVLGKLLLPPKQLCTDTNNNTPSKLDKITDGNGKHGDANPTNDIDTTDDKAEQQNASLATSQALGLAREVYFYEDFAPSLRDHVGIPQCYYSAGDMLTGEKVLILEYFSADDYVQAGYFFGPFSPHNWGKDLSALTKNSDITALDVAKKAFNSIAQLHAKYWVDPAQHSNGDQPSHHHATTSQPGVFPSYLRGVSWLHGQGRDEWETSQSFITSSWNTSKDKRTNMKWDQHLLDVVGASLTKISWEDYQQELKSIPYTLIHSDFHPGNCLLSVSTGNIVILDWEACGVGSGPQDIAQFMISHMNTTTREECESQIIEFYYHPLVKHSHITTASYTAKDFWRDYINGGIGRWVWLLCLLTGMSSIDDHMLQYFHDQIASFIRSHNITPDSVPMPRA